MLLKGGGSVTANALAFIKNEFVVAANSSKPLLHFWPVNSQEQLSGSRFVVPGKVTALAVSPDGVYCVAAVSETIYIWQISSGKMMSVLSRHYQAVTSLTFTDDGTHFCSAGQDGMLLVWKLSTALSSRRYNNQEAAPLYSFSDHTLPITNVVISAGGMPMLVSVSLDRTCHIYDLASGSILLNLVFPEALTSVAVDKLFTKVYVGTLDGNIFEFALQIPRTKEYHVSHDALPSKQRFLGHTGAVTTLSISLDGESLLSGGNDENVRLWHIPSKQLIRAIPHKGTITNAKFILAPKAMFDQETELKLITNNFERMIKSQSTNDPIEILVTSSIEKTSIGDDESSMDDFQLYGEPNTVTNCSGVNNNAQSNGASGSEVEELRAEVKRLKKINKELYEYSIKAVLLKDQ